MALTSSDMQNIKNLFKTVLDEDESLVRKNDISHLPTKEEFYDSIDKISGELKTVREEMTLLSDMKRQVNDHEDRLNRIDKRLKIKPLIN